MQIHINKYLLECLVYVDDLPTLHYMAYAYMCIMERRATKLIFKEFMF